MFLYSSFCSIPTFTKFKDMLAKSHKKSGSADVKIKGRDLLII